MTTHKIIPEILDEVSAAKTAEEAANILKAHATPAFRNLIYYTYFPGVQFDIMELPKYIPDVGDVGMNMSSLFNEMRKFYIFTEEYKISLERKQRILLDILETVHPTEAELVGRILGRDLKIPVMTYEFVRSVFPDILPE